MSRRDIRYQAAVVRDHHALLLFVHDRESDGRFWVFPGGGREVGETAEECVRREISEEAGLDIAVLRFLFATPDIPGGTYDWLHTYHCEIISGTAMPGVEPEVDGADHMTIREVAWFDLRDPGSWGTAITQDRITYPLLQQLCAALGYL
jgi:8-oxo-dGTP diphosphatase